MGGILSDVVTKMSYSHGDRLAIRHMGFELLEGILFGKWKAC